MLNRNSDRAVTAIVLLIVTLVCCVAVVLPALVQSAVLIALVKHLLGS